MPEGGNPASNRIAVSFRAERGVSVAGLRMTLFPAARAGPTLCATRFSGKLNGLIAKTTPQGTRKVKPKRFPAPGAPSRGTISPAIRFASSAETINVSAARETSKRASARILPSSRVIVRAKSSNWFSTISAARFRILERSNPESLRMTWVPWDAAFKAVSTSLNEALGTVSTVWPSYGFRTSIFSERSCQLSS